MKITLSGRRDRGEKRRQRRGLSEKLCFRAEIKVKLNNFSGKYQLFQVPYHIIAHRHLTALAQNCFLFTFFKVMSQGFSKNYSFNSDCYMELQHHGKKSTTCNEDGVLEMMIKSECSFSKSNKFLHHYLRPVGGTEPHFLITL